MKKIIVLSATSLLMLFSACSNSSSGKAASDSSSFSRVDTNKLSAGQTFYQCPMNLEVISDKPGACWKCKMDLVKMEKK